MNRGKQCVTSSTSSVIEALEGRQLMSVNAWKGGNGNWSDASKWSLGHVPTKSEDVTINASGDYTVTIGDGKTSTPAVANKLTVGGVSGTQSLSLAKLANLTTTSTYNILAGDNLTLNGGALYTYATSGTATLDGTLNINGSSTGLYSDANLGDNVTYAGTGKINLTVAGGAAYYNYAGLRGYGATLGSGITTTVNTGDIYGGFNNAGSIVLNGTVNDRVYLTSLTNKGTVTSTTGAQAIFGYLNNQKTINLSNGRAKFSYDFKNTGTINATNTPLEYGMNLTTAGVGNVVRANSPVSFSGTYDGGGKAFTFDNSGQWLWMGGRLMNGLYDPSAANALKFDASIGGTYGATQNVTITGDWNIPAGTYVSNYGKLTLSGPNRKINLNGSATQTAGLYFYGGELNGTGEVLFNTPGANMTARNVIGGNGITIGSGITVHGYSGTLGGGLVNNGTILADNANTTIQINDIVNNGNLISAPGLMKVYRYTQGTAGALTLGVGGTTAGTNVGQFNFADTSYASALAGTINAVLLNDYKPTAGSKYTFATFAKPVTGAFSTQNLDAGNGIAFDATQTAPALTLAAKNVTGAFAAASAGAVTVTGTSAADTITAKQSLGVLYATMNGKTSVFYDPQVKTVTVNAGSGNDKVTASGTRSFKLYGGAGNDTLTGGNGADSLYGEAGSDTLYGGGDKVVDTLDGGADKDVKGSADSNDILVSIP